MVLADANQKNYIDHIVQDMNQVYLESERKTHALRKLRFMKGQTRAPKAFQKVVASGLRSPLSYRLVQTITGMIVKEDPSFKRLPSDDNDRDSASRLQSSAGPLLQDLARVAHKPLWYNFVDAVVADGKGVMKCYRDVWDGFPIQMDEEEATGYNQRVANFLLRGASHPLRMRQVDALNFNAPLTDQDPPYVLEKGKRSTLGVCDAYGMRVGTNGKFEVLPDATAFHQYELPSGVPALVDVEEIWFDDQVFVRIQGEVFRAPNDLGFKPYVWTSGETSSHPDPALNSLSVLYPYAGIEPWLNTMLTVLAAWGVIGGTPILYTSKKMAPNGSAIPDSGPNLSEIPLGKRIDLGMGGEIGFVQPPPVGREVLEFIQFLVDFCDRAGLPALAYGTIGTRTPGTAFQGALEQSISKVTPIKTACEGAAAELVKMQWRIIEQLGKPMVVTGIGVQAKSLLKRKALGRFVVDPKDIGGYYDLHAKIKIGNQQDMISRGMHAAFMRSHQLWTRERAMEYADVDDPFQEYQGIMRNKLEESPLIQQITLQEALKQSPEFQARSQELQAQGVDTNALLMGEMGGQPAGAVQKGASNISPGPAGAGAPKPAGSAPAPKRGGTPTGTPKRPGGTRQNAQGSRGHS